jgi:hypothetical protein
MPFKSKSQQRWMFAAEKTGQVKPGMAEQFAHETPSIKALPVKAPKAQGIKVPGIKMPKVPGVRSKRFYGEK